VGGTCFQGFESDLFYVVESGEFEATFSQVFEQPFGFCVLRNESFRKERPCCWLCLDA
jgi:hypothetical protein